MPHLDRFAMSELASESEPMGDFSEEQGARLSAERAMQQRDRREGRAGGRGVRRPGALIDDDGASRAGGRAGAWEQRESARRALTTRGAVCPHAFPPSRAGCACCARTRR
jgi:hypothetical protein